MSHAVLAVERVTHPEFVLPQHLQMSEKAGIDIDWPESRRTRCERIAAYDGLRLKVRKENEMRALKQRMVLWIRVDGSHVDERVVRVPHRVMGGDHVAA